MRRIARTTKAEIQRVKVPTIETVITQKKSHIIKKIEASLPKDETDMSRNEDILEQLLELA